MLEKKKSEPFIKEIKTSLIFHAAVLGIFTIKHFVFSSPSIDYKSAIRVDIVGLPDKITQKPKPISKKDEPTKETAKQKPVEKPQKPVAPKKEEAVVINKKKDTSKDVQKNAIDRLRALEKIKSSVNTEKAQEDAIERLKQQEYRGNVLAAGNSLSGTDKIQYDAYIGELDSHVKRYWDLPRYLSGQGLKSVVKVKIDARGFVTYSQIVTSSGNPTHDDVALQTVAKASPFPLPPFKFRGTLEVHGFNIEFQEREE